MKRARALLAALALATASLATTAQAVPVEWSTASGGNGHSYEVILSATNWVAANDAAQASLHNGVTGHLVTITSPEEQAFLNSLNPSGTRLWLGASDAADEGTWRWVSGPEDGQLLDTSYTNWWNNEPNQWRGLPENYAVGWWNTGWNDIPSWYNFGYIVEYSQPATVPLPAALGFVLSGLGALMWLRRKP